VTANKGEEPGAAPFGPAGPFEPTPASGASTEAPFALGGPEPEAGWPSEVVRLEGHVLDSLVLPKVLDTILDAGASYRILGLEVGRTRLDPSHVRLEVAAPDESRLEAVLAALQVHGVNVEDAEDALALPAPLDGVLPDDFYASTNLPTQVRVRGRWVEVERPEMDCAVVLDDGRARTVPMHRVRRGDLVVVGWRGVRVGRPRRSEADEPFSFMTSEVSSEKPKGLGVARVAERLRRARAEQPHGGRVLVVAGPAVVHTGAGPALASLVHEGFVQVLFAGNGFAAHDVESAVFGTSLGVSLADGRPLPHLRAINGVRRFGSLAAAVEAGWLRRGVLFECVRHGVPFVLGGSLRDDGPIPDVITDVVAAQDAMRVALEGVEVALMLASTLHGIATGNLLPAAVETFCVDINQAVVVKLADRGTHQALGIVTDVGLFVRELAEALGCSATCEPEPTEAAQ
jgi:lysine-ketoglutarate reductase/saccharopine dehydrogenase-like protein (TIGR00300 family)